MFVAHILEAMLNADPWTLFSAGFASALQGARKALDEALNPMNEYGPAFAGMIAAYANKVALVRFAVRKS